VPCTGFPSSRRTYHQLRYARLSQHLTFGIFVPAEVADFKNDPVGRMQALAKEPGRENVEAVSADLVAMPEATRPADVLWLHLFYHDLHTALMQKKGATAAGFVLDAESTILANKDDPHSTKVFDPSIKGKTDRFVYRFVKP
jgi:predicted methyltransferase